MRIRKKASEYEQLREKNVEENKAMVSNIFTGLVLIINIYFVFEEFGIFSDRSPVVCTPA